MTNVQRLRTMIGSAVAVLALAIVVDSQTVIDLHRGKVIIQSTAADALDLAGGLNAGSGNVSIIGTDGRLPALTSTYVADLTGLGSLLNTNDSIQGTPASTTETVLRTYAVPADTLNVDGRTVVIVASGTTSANANAKTIRLRWGGTGINGDVVAIVGPITSASGVWRLDAEISRIVSNSQRTQGLSYYLGTGEAGVVPTIGTASRTDTGAISVYITGENGTATANDIVYEASRVWVQR